MLSNSYRELLGGVLKRGMTSCSDSDEGAEKPNKNQKKKRRNGEKHVSFPPDEQIVSGFAEHRNTTRKGKLLVNIC